MAGTNNILQWDPPGTNMEIDSAYAADAQRVGGAPNGVEFPSATANKLFYQLSTFSSALAQALANKGYNISDASISVLEGVLSNVITSSDLKPNLTSVAFSTTPVFDAIATNGFDFVMAGDVASSTLINTSVGQILTFVIKQGAVTYTFVPPANVNGWIPIDPTPNNITVQQFIVRMDGTIWPLSTEINILIAEITALQAQLAIVPVSTFYNSGGRLLAAVYHNTGTTSRRVAVSYSQPSSGTLTLYSGTTSLLATKQVASQQGGSGGTGTRLVWCEVPAGSFYSVVTDTAGGLVSWVETQ